MDTARAQRGTFAPAFVRDWRTTDSSKDEAEGKAFFEQRLVWLWDAKDTFVSGSIVAEDEGVATVVRKDGQVSGPCFPARFADCHAIAGASASGVLEPGEPAEIRQSQRYGRAHVSQRAKCCAQS